MSGNTHTREQGREGRRGGGREGGTEERYLEEGGDHVTQCVRVGLEQTVTHALVLDKHLIGILVDEVVDFTGSGGPGRGREGGREGGKG